MYQRFNLFWALVFSYNGDLTEKANLVSTINENEMGQTFILLIKWIVSQIKVHMDLQDSLSGESKIYVDITQIVELTA